MPELLATGFLAGQVVSAPTELAIGVPFEHFTLVNAHLEGAPKLALAVGPPALG
ncbi:hypothetical protein [Hymenobacter sp. BT559]|uniref:hypothetical protein n=1 Tax=Hymenobacter sp. BT559 TaxID=2795729 RepID=UPI001AAD9485|nr:hypothetical protein [Hymenobacter sp. BT559]